MVNYTLHYFNGRGRAEISRLIFAAAGIEYTDNRIEDWPKTKADTPIGQVPFLDIDGLKLPQSLSVARYLAREFSLVGKDNIESAKADSIVDTCIDLMTSFYYKVFIINDMSAKEVALRKFLKDEAITGLENVEKLIRSFTSDGFSVGNQLTWADLFIHETTHTLMIYQPDIIEKFEVLKRIRELVEKNENVSNYLKKRPVTPF